MISETASQQLFETAARVYGPQGAADIFAQVGASIEYANVCLSPPTPINSVGVGIFNAAYEGYSDSYAEGIVTEGPGFDILLKQADPKPILPQIKRVSIHEVAHIARIQFGELEGTHDEDDQTVLLDVLEEGIAVQAEIEFLGDSNRDSRSEDVGMLMAGLAEVMDAGDVEDEEYVAFLVGGTELAWKGYKVGHFVIATMVVQGYTMQDLLRAPDNTLRKVAESLV